MLARVARDALDLRVLSLEREVSAGVLELRRRLPALLVVAVLAGGAQLAAMLVEVAGRGLHGDSQGGLSPRMGLAQLVDGRIDDGPVLVALVALEGRVPAVEREPGAGGGQARPSPAFPR